MRSAGRRSIRTICEVEDYLWINYKDGIYRIKESAMEVQEPTFISSALQLPGVSIQVICRKENEFGLAAHKAFSDTIWIRN